MRYGFIGLGNMATAIAGGMVRSGEFVNDKILGFDISKERCELLKKDIGIDIENDVVSLCENADVLILAVKPQVICTVCEEIREHLKSKLIISIAAGKTVDFLENEIGHGNSIIRVMPNINAMVGAATSAYTCNVNVSDEQKTTLERIFKTVGTIVELPEKLFSIFTAIGGSSPAFAYIYIDALARVGVKYGMTKAQALSIAASTVYGSAKMVMESGLHPMELTDRVCSPAGTTIEGVLSLQGNAFEAAIHEAIAAVVEKDRTL